MMQQLAADPDYSHEGKMYGILLVETPEGENRVLKAFSGLLNGSSDVEGWVPPIPGRDRVAVGEAVALQELEAIKNESIALKQLPQRLEYETLFASLNCNCKFCTIGTEKTSCSGMKNGSCCVKLLMEKT
ncbi:MAG: hypothetical protein HC849_17895 [Oscillatoriales cyanobacterium RU_3_3]|nr:hypothetical protein [Oscillatoriales cyanobacterium RU_3_3]